LQELLGRFLDLPKKYLCLLQSNSCQADYKKGAKLFGVGDKPRKLYCLLEGDVEVYMP
jgi:hypothetical protein